MSMPLASMASISSCRMTGSMTTPLPMMFTESGRKMPEGTVWRTNPSPSKTSEWPAFGPPWKRAITL